MAFIQFENLSFWYPGAQRPALRGISLSIGEGEFVVLCGTTGSGKTTLLRLLKPPVSPAGRRAGGVTVLGRAVEALAAEEAVRDIGMVFQSPEAQTVADRTGAELAFGLENQAVPTDEMRRRIGEMAGFFDLEALLSRPVHNLSGGQRQMVNLCSCMLLRPRLLLLDEPIAQLDPVGAREFLQLVRRLNAEWGVTVILCEHRLEEVYPLADRALWMEEGAVALRGQPGAVCRSLWSRPSDRPFVPAPAALFLRNEREEERPLPREIREFRAWADGLRWTVAPPAPRAPAGGEALEAHGLWYRYERSLPDVVRGLCLSLPRGTFLCLLGGNGAGKTTLLKLLAGIYRPQRGRVRAGNAAAYLPQRAQAFFTNETVRRQLAAYGAPEDGFEPWLESHPLDLSGGQQQKLALACLLASDPPVLLLDEPTRGLDPVSRAELGQTLLRLTGKGAAVLAATHDMEFAARFADACAFLFDGAATQPQPTRAFFAENFFYTTAVGRILRDKTPRPALLAEDADGS